MTQVPHWDYPFRFGSDGHAIEVEQDSLQDVSNCVRAVLLTRIGERQEMPTFGTPDFVFGVQPLPLDELVDAVSEQEPRAIMLVEQHPDKFANLAADIQVQVSTREGVSSV